MAGSHELNLTAECISDIADPITRISEHPDCRRTYQAGWNEMVELAAHAAKPHEFPANSPRLSLRWMSG